MPLYTRKRTKNVNVRIVPLKISFINLQVIHSFIYSKHVHWNKKQQNMSRPQHKKIIIKHHMFQNKNNYYSDDYNIRWTNNIHKCDEVIWGVIKQEYAKCIENKKFATKH